jgi:hypothetical protein
VKLDVQNEFDFRCSLLNWGVNRSVSCVSRVFRLLGSRETY